ncbi:MAG: CHAT domain-containing tetratricopeptide repeat protein [Caldilineaceae bacterium]
MKHSTGSDWHAVLTQEGAEGLRRLCLDYLDARQFSDYERLLEIAAEFPESALQHVRRHYHAVLLAEKHQFDQAEIMLRQLLNEPLSPQQRARTAMELAIQLDDLGQWDEANEHYQTALAGYRASANQLGLARAYNNLGIMFTSQVEQGLSSQQCLQKALDHHTTALKLLETLDETTDTQAEIAKNRHGMGKAYALQQAYPQAEAAFAHSFAFYAAEAAAHDRAVVLSDQAALVSQPQGQWLKAKTELTQAIELLQTQADDLDLAETLMRYGNVLAQQGQVAEALTHYEQALLHGEAIRKRLSVSTARVEYRATSEALYTAPLTLHLQQGNALAAFTLAERARSRVLADLLVNQAAKPRQASVVTLEEQRQSLRQQLEMLYSPDAKPDELHAIQQQLARLDRQIDALDPTFAALESADALDAQAMQQCLSPDAVLLTYVNDDQGQLWALCLSKHDAHITSLSNLKLLELQKIITEHLEGEQPGLKPDSANHLAPLTLFAQLYKQLIEPVWSYLEPARTVYIIPTGPLHYLPLGALAPEAGEPPLLAAGRRVVYAPSATVLFTYCHQCRPSPHASVLTIAPHYKSEPLYFIRSAAISIANKVGGSQMIGAKATRSGLLANAANHRIVCFLGHAWFNARFPMLSHLKLSDGGLQASEILRELRLQTDLVILAACETGRTQILRGDEILGLSRAMLYAGTPALLVTLWPVHEIPTRLLIEDFFGQLGLNNAQPKPIDPATSLMVAQNWLRTLTYAEAHRSLSQWLGMTPQRVEAELHQLWQLTHQAAPPQSDSLIFDHPFFWSPYILIGEPAPNVRNPV